MKYLITITVLIIGSWFVLIAGLSCKEKNMESQFPQLPNNSIPELSSEYSWKNLKIGGGGYVTGMAVHPLDKKIMYIRTDVGGAYRWDNANSKWVQMLNWVGPENANLIGVDGIALDPNNPDRVYLALGKRINEEGGVYRSEDRGETWTKLLNVFFEGNGRDARWIGECIAVDPLNSNIIYVGTRKEGLWRSNNDGKTWSRVQDVSDGHIGNEPTGVRTIVFDSTNGKNGLSTTIYIGVPYKGIYLSNNGGDSFSLMFHSPSYPARMQVVKSELFVTHGNGFAYFSNGEWNDVSPESYKNYVALAVDEFDNNKIVVAQRYGAFFNPIFRSVNKGKTWEKINTKEVPAKLNVTIPWWSKTRFSSATAGMALTSDGSGELYYTDWFGVWQTPNVWAKTTEWNTVVEGHEETVVLTVVSPPSGPLLYSGVADVFGFIHKNLEHYPEERIPNFQECWSISVCENYPSNLARLGAKGWDGKETTLMISNDYGESWTNRTLPNEEMLGQIAISSSDPKFLIYVSGNGNVYYSNNSGDSWNKGQNAPENIMKAKDIWDPNLILTSDKVDESFYIFKDGILYASNDGVSWEARNKTQIPYTNDRFRQVVSVPDSAGEIWICTGKDGLWKTSDKGKNFIKISDFENARCMCWGAPAPGTNIPTAYVYGIQSGKWGIYRSVNNGAWTKINNDKHQFPAGVKTIDGDKNVFGRIYVGSGGYGISYGEPLQ